MKHKYTLFLHLTSGTIVTVALSDHSTKLVARLHDLMGRDHKFRFQNEDKQLHTVVQMMDVVAVSLQINKQNEYTQRIQAAQAEYFENLVRQQKSGEEWKQ